MRYVIWAAIFVLAVSSFAFEWQVRMDGRTGTTDSSYCVIGTRTTATTSYDAGLDSLSIDFGMERPFKIHFLHTISGIPYPIKLFWDYQSSYDTLIVWNGEAANVTTTDYTLSWSTTTFPADSGILMLGTYTIDGADTTWINMLTTSTVTLPNGTYFDIQFRRLASPIEDRIPPAIVYQSIEDGDTITDATTPIVYKVIDDDSGVNAGTLSFVFNGIEMGFMVSDSVSADTTIFTYTPLLGYQPIDSVFFAIADFAGNRTTDTVRFYYLPARDTLFDVTCFVTGGMGADMSGTTLELVELGLVGTTDMMGRYVFTDIPMGTYTIEAEHVGFLPFDTTVYVDTSLFVMINMISDTIDTVSDDYHLFTCRVLPSGAIFDLAGSLVEVMDLGIARLTDSLGQVTIDSIPTGTHRIKASREGCVSVDTMVEFTDDVNLLLFLEPVETPHYTISGTVALEGTTTLSGSTVIANSFSADPITTTTDISGFYRIELSAIGAYSVIASHTGYIPDTTYALVMADTTVNFSLLRDTGISEKQLGASGVYFANGANSVSIVSANAGSISIIDFAGRIIFASPMLAKRTLSIDKSMLPSGFYYVMFRAENGVVSTYKMPMVR